MEVLVCGDLHTKYHIFDKVKQWSQGYDKVIFLGDYVDDWGACPEASYNLLSSLIEWKKEEPDKVILLLGNHDLSEYFGDNLRCSGFNQQTHNLVAPLFRENDRLFDYAYAIEDILFTHAGLTNSWLKACHLPLVKSAEDYSDMLNGVPNADGDDIVDLEYFTMAGYARGGFESPSPVWADKSELIADHVKGIIQVVGHTPVEKIEKHSFDDSELIFCDTHSNYSNGRPIGNNELLEIHFDSTMKPTFKTITID